MVEVWPLDEKNLKIEKGPPQKKESNTKIFNIASPIDKMLIIRINSYIFQKIVIFLFLKIGLLLMGQVIF
jgi:hypothetical protein